MNVFVVTFSGRVVPEQRGRLTCSTCPSRDSNPNWAAFETAASAVGLHGPSCYGSGSPINSSFGSPKTGPERIMNASASDFV